MSTDRSRTLAAVVKIMLIVSLFYIPAAHGAAPASLGRRSLLAADDRRPDQGLPGRGFNPGGLSGFSRTPGSNGNQWGRNNNNAAPSFQPGPSTQGNEGGDDADGQAAATGGSSGFQSQPVFQQAAQPTAGGFGGNRWQGSGNNNRWTNGNANGWGNNGNGWGRGGRDSRSGSDSSSGAGSGSGVPASSSGWGQGIPSAANWGGGNSGGNRPGRAWRDNRGDRASLGALTGSIGGYSGIRRRPIATTGAAGTLAQGMWRRGNARAAAQSLAQAYSGGQADAAAQAMASAATSGSTADSSAAAEAVAEATINHPRVAPQLLAKSASYAVSNGLTDSYADTMADAFVYARRKKHMPQMTTAVADAIATGGAPTRYAYGQAIATAIAQGGDSQAAVAEATATAICAGGSTASAWASAYAVALSQDSRGCLVLNQAKAMAQAQCGDGASQSFSQAEATSTVLGFCGLMDLLPGGINMGWSGGNSGSNSNSYGGLMDGWSGK